MAKTMASLQAFPSLLLPRAPLAFLSRLKLPFPKLPFPSLSNACHAGYRCVKCALSWAAILKFAVSVKSGTKISASSPGSSRFPMRRLWGRGWNLSSPRIFRKFWISNHPTTFIISRLLSFHSPQNLKLQNVVRTLRLYLITSFQHFWTTHVNATGSRTFFLSGLK